MSFEATMQLITQISLPVLLAGCIGGSAAAFANMIYFMIIGKINERSPENERISYFWWGTEVRMKFKQMYPGSRLVLLLDSCVVIMILCFIVVIRIWVFS
jgi:hypothetical protein